MPFPRARTVNPRLGTYFGIFTSAFASLVLMLLILEQLGVSDAALRGVMLGGPLALYAVMGLAARSNEPLDFFASGRRAPAVYNGLVLAISAGGGTGLVAITGLFFLHGFDAWCLVIGLTAGLVAMAILIAPYLRKFGAYTVPSYLGRRFDSRFLRFAAAAVVAVPMLLVIAAELRMGLFVTAWLTGQPTPLVAAVLAGTVAATVLLGGMRSLSWANTAAAIAALLAVLVPAAVVAALVTNLPFPQLSHGPVLRTIGRLEAIQGVPIPLLPPFAFEFAGLALEPLSRRFATPFGSVGALSFVLTSLTLMAGVAAGPWLLPRSGTTPTVYEARKSLGWATVVLGVLMLTVSAIAVFLRDIVMDTLVGQSALRLPEWFHTLAALGFAGVDGHTPRLPLASFSFKRDAILFALPIAGGYPAVMLYLALAGAIAAVVAAASLAVVALGHVLAEDVVRGLKWEPLPDRRRLAIARASVVMAAALGTGLAVLIPADPLALVLAAFALSGSALFPVLVLSIWWKRLTAPGAIAGLTVGFAVAIFTIFGGEAARFGLPSALAGVFAIPASFVATLVVTWLSPRPARPVLERVKDMRVPGGETVHDREMRLMRLKQRQRR
jgi:cation/acetate symporter